VAAGDRVAENLVAGAGRLQLWGSGEVADEGNAGEVTGSCRAEGPR